MAPPAEVAAWHAAQAAGSVADERPTLELPAHVRRRRSRRRTTHAVGVAAAAALIGASALTVSRLADPFRCRCPVRLAEPAATVLPPAERPALSPDPVASATTTRSAGITMAASSDLSRPPDQPVPAAATAPWSADAALAQRLHRELAPSMPRVQAATAEGMREGSGFFVSDHGTC